jgi:hypothetical protein
VLPPPGVADTVTGFTVKLHAAPGCVKVTICPATVTVPMRSSAVGLAAAVTVPSPEPLAPTVTVSHAVLVVATHAQPPGAVTVTSLSPPATGTATDSGATVKLHATPSCVIVTVCPPTVTVPLRDSSAVFAATVTVTDPSPLPLVSAEIVNQLVSLVAVHAHSVGAVTLTITLPASLPSDSVCALTENVQDGGESGMELGSVPD